MYLVHCPTLVLSRATVHSFSTCLVQECVRALYSGIVQHVPFRGSRLTHIMRDAFIGDRLAHVDGWMLNQAFITYE